MAEKISYIVAPQGKITRFRYTDINAQPVKSPKTSMTGTIASDERYTDVVYPVRRNFLRDNRLDDVKFPDEEFKNIYSAFESDRVDFSTEFATPHKIMTYLQTYLQVNASGSYSFQIRTCGAVIIWVNGERQFEFSPYTRNTASSAHFKLSLMGGSNEVVIYMEDLAERDVSYYFDLQNENDVTLKGFIPLPCDSRLYHEAEKLLAGMYFERDMFKKGPVTVKLPSANRRKSYTVRVRFNPRNRLIEDDAQDGDITDFEVPDTVVEIHRSDASFQIGTVESIPTAGLTTVEFGIEMSDQSWLTKALTCSLYDQSKFESIISGAHLQTRKLQALAYYAELTLPDINVALVEAKIGMLSQEDTNEILTQYHSAFQLIEDKGDCADFILTPLIACFRAFPKGFPDEFAETVKRLCLNFRYWIDEPGNDVMWYFSENHALLFHSCQYLAGSLYPNEVFSVSHRTGADQAALGKQRLLDWFTHFEQVGFSEWNSTTYLPIDLIGFFSLYLSAPDDDIRQASKRALDYTFRIIAMNYQGGTLASTYGRVYEHNLKAMQQGELSSLAEIAWGNGYFNNSLRVGALFAMSDYQPPSDLVNLFNSQPGALPLRIQYLQGASRAHTYLYKTPSYSLASVINYRAFERGHQQHIMNISLGDSTMLWVNNPGEAAYSGNNRPSFWAGNDFMPVARQYNNYLFMHYSLEKSDYKYIHLYLPYWDLDSIEQDDNFIFIRKGTAYLAAYFTNPFTITQYGAVTRREVRVSGEEQVVMLRLGCKSLDGDFAHFVNASKHALIRFENGTLTVRDKQLGMFEFSDDLKLNGTLVDYSCDFTPTIEQIDSKSEMEKEK
ncbi:hypothetical protein [Lacticaseibacillus jixiensis]|uniref:hypothetical protein n=1 Tax=Lacticaseibacillus jixiensis TaxID=3231926 RepID=UPI0036F3C712